MLSMMPAHIFASTPPQDIRAVWLTTVFNIDYPSTKNNITAQKEEFIKKIDELKAVGLNTVVVQVRPKADALYKSSINPWSDVLTGKQGQDPGYDPMAFMIEEAHKRGMAFHAWLNPYRVTTQGTDVNTLALDHPARKNPSMVFSYNNALYYNPESAEVKKHIVDTVVEIVKNYKVDGIHFDDYFYPSNYPLPQGEGKDGVVANSRRTHVNDMVEQVGAAVKRTNKQVLFGISPVGIWKNRTSDSTGSSTGGYESYYGVAGDTRTWIKNEWIDYVVPQIYWETGHKLADYETLVSWWSNEVRGTKVKLYIGHGIYRDVVATQIDTQLLINQKYPEVRGSFYFSTKDLLANRQGCREKIKAFNESSPLQAGVPSNPSVSQPSVPTGQNLSGSTGTVTASPLNIRSGAGTQHVIVAKAAKGSKVTILNTASGWHQVRLASGQVGWASAQFVRIDAAVSSAPKANAAPTRTITGTAKVNALNVRSGAGTSHASIAKINKGTKVTILESKSGWYKVRLSNGKVGWILQSLISV